MINIRYTCTYKCSLLIVIESSIAFETKLDVFTYPQVSIEVLHHILYYRKLIKLSIDLKLRAFHLFKNF